MKNFIYSILGFFFVINVYSQECSLTYSIQDVEFVGSGIRIIQTAGFPFGGGSTCPSLDTMSINETESFISFNLFYNTAGMWPQFFCTRTDTFFLDSIDLLSTEIIFHTHLLIDGNPYPNLDTLFDCDIDTLNLNSNTIQYVTDCDIEVYPNPSIELIKIRGKLPEYVELNIYNVFGTLCYSEKNFTVTKEVNISLLPAGNYFIHLVEKDKLWVKNLVIIR